ncbi:MAG: hypothetical protein OXS47_02495 [Chloroflexota bacterium]|nr:hypothetical protein [Chloroflexota bacterium]
MVSRSEVDERLLDLERELGAEEFVRSLVVLVSHQAQDAGRWGKLFDYVAAALRAEESDVLDAAAALAARHHALEGDESLLRSWLGVFATRSDLARQLGGEPRQVLDDVGQALLAQARLQGDAIRMIWREPMLEPKDAAVALGAKATNREKVRQYRERSWLLGLPSGRGYLYPAFQFDHERRDIFAEVRAVNERLDAANDPWGVASWWISPHSRLGRRPADLVGTGRGDDLVAVAAASTEPVG